MEIRVQIMTSLLEDRLTDDEDLVGANIIPFAAVFGGDFLCMDFRDNPDKPSVILWGHNESDELEPVTYFVSEPADDFFQKIV